MSATRRRWLPSDRGTQLVVAIALIGAAVQVVTAVASFPMTGDPVYSYSYRAMLIAHGDPRGLWVMWHVPGYPLLLGITTRVFGGAFAPYTVGVAFSIASIMGLVGVVDAIVRRITPHAGPRLVAASFVALYEGVVFIASAPLTEPPFLLLIFSAVALAVPGSMSPRRCVVIGLLLGLAATIRLEAMAAAAGLAMFVVADGIWMDRLGQSAVRRAAGRAGTIALGFSLGAGWMLANVDFVAFAIAAQENAFTVAPRPGGMGQIVRLAEATYVATVEWLPRVVLLPYWLLAGVGLVAALGSRNARRTTTAILSVVGPVLIAVTLSVMHKRTGSFLLPAVAVWIALGTEYVAGQLGIHRTRWRQVVVAGVLLLNAGQVLRIPYRLATEPVDRKPITRIQGRLLASSPTEASPRGPSEANPRFTTLPTGPCSIRFARATSMFALTPTIVEIQLPSWMPFAGAVSDT